jgi:TANFOR domain-containing protein
MQNLLGFLKYGGLRKIILSVAFIFSLITNRAQTQYYVNINLVQVIAPYSSTLSDYVINPSKVAISLQMVAGGPAVQNIKLFATIRGDNNIQIKTNINALSSLPEITLNATSPSQMVNALDIRNVFDLDYVDITGTTLSNLQTNGLPAGNYQLCVQAVQAVTDPAGGQIAGSPASLESCSRSFTISAPTANVAIRNIQVIAPYSNKLLDYLNNPAKVIVTLYSNITYSQFNIKLLATLKGDNGVQIVTNSNSLDLLQEITLSNGIHTLVLNASSISNIFNVEGVTLQGTTYNDLVNGNGLPPGNYQLCITPVEATTDPATGQQAGTILSDQMCSAPFTINAPTANVAVRSVQVIYPYTTHLSDFLNNPAKVIITLGSNITYPQFKIKLLASLKGDNGIQITTTPNNLNLLQDITLTSGQPIVVLNASSINNLFNVEGVSLQGITYNELVNGNGLPEGNYQLCITPVVAETNATTGMQAGQILSDERCSNLIAITNLEPPFIINPLSGSEILVRNPQNVLFNWSIPAGVKGIIQYDFKMVEITDSLRNPNDAMQSATTPAFFEKTVNSNILLYGPGEPPLTPGNRYAFMVTAQDPQNNVVFRNGGRSEVAYFIYTPYKSQYIPIVNNNNQTTDTSQNKNPISVMDAPELNCSCKSTISDKTVNNSNAKNGAVVHVGKFDMTLNNDVIAKGDSLSGTGTIPVPFLNSSLFKIRVEFSNLKVNSSNQAVSGTVKAKRNANAVSVLPAIDKPNVKPQPFSSTDITNIGNYINNNASTAIADIKNSINSAGWEMPFGIQKEISGEKIVVAITDMVFAPDQAGFNACLAFDVPEGGGNNTLALGAKNICFKDNKSLCGDATLFLVEDFKIDALNFKFLKASGNNNTQAGTYAIFDTSGFKKLHIKAEYDFSQNVIVRKADKGIVKATFETDIQSWNNWYVNVNIDTFSIAGYDEWSFALKSPAYYDHSDSINPPDLPKSAIEGKKNFLDKSWHGFFFSDLQASLPAIIKRADKKPFTIDVKNFMIDDQGITGDISAANVLAISDGDLGGWYYSLDSIQARFVNTSFIKGGLNGKVLLPTSGSPSNSSQDELDYTCTLSKPSADSSMKFQFVIQPKNNISAKLWAATFNLDKTSNITISNDNNNFNAVATLNGDISIEADLSPIPKISFKAMQFQELKLMTQSPYISGNVTFMGFSSPDKSAGGFPITISDIKPKFSGSEAGIMFNLHISLADIKALPDATFNLGILGDIGMTNGRPSWGNPHLQVDSISIVGPLGPLDINGYIKFFDNDATYGNGLKGGLTAKLDLGANKIVISSNVMFGHTTFNYWYVDLLAMSTIGTPIVPPVMLFGLGGGVYYNMSKAQDISPDALLKGTSNDLNRYKPSNNVIGFKATIVVGTGNGTPFHAKGTLSMEFTSDFGVKSVDLDVDAAMMSGVTDDDSKAPINGHGHIGYDFAQKIFDAGVGLNINFTIITGSGWLALNINGQNGEWYFKLGEPSNRINVNVLDLVQLNAYFMMGSNIPGIPDPPSEILQYFPQYKSSRDNNLVSNKLYPGFAFGAGLEYGPVDLTFLIFYMNFDAALGFDVSLRQYSEGCNGSTNLPGINGWYANGQFYAWVKFAFGINVDVWFYSGKIDVASVQAAALFEAGLINPSWFQGWLYGHYDVLGGLISGDMHFNVSIGDKCVPESNPLGMDMPIISDVKPGDGEKDISIGSNPLVAFNFPVADDYDVTSTSSDGTTVLNTIHIDLTGFTITRNSDNYVVADLNNNQNLSFTDEMKLATLYTTNALDPQTNYTVTVSVKAFQIVNGGGKVPISYKNKPIEETKTISFKTGDCLHRLDENAQTLLGSYPFKNQRYLLQKEQTTGFIQLDKNYPCLINDPNYTLLAQFVSYQSPNQTSVQEVSVGQNGNQLTFQIPTLPNEQITKLRIIKRMKVNKFVMQAKIALNYEDKNSYLSFGQGSNNNIITVQNVKASGASYSHKPVDLELYSYYFKTSKYNTLGEKLGNADYSANASMSGFGNLEGYSADFNFAEGFDTYDVNETTFEAFGEKFVIYPLVHISEQAPGNSWIQNYVKNYFYSNWQTAYIYGADYKYDIAPYNIRKNSTGLQCLIFEPSLEPVGILPISGEPPLSALEIATATNEYTMTINNSMHGMKFH